jgi:hypothetical protein
LCYARSKFKQLLLSVQSLRREHEFPHRCKRGLVVPGRGRGRSTVVAMMDHRSIQRRARARRDAEFQVCMLVCLRYSSACSVPLSAGAVTQSAWQGRTCSLMHLKQNGSSVGVFGQPRGVVLARQIMLKKKLEQYPDSLLYRRRWECNKRVMMALQVLSEGEEAREAAEEKVKAADEEKRTQKLRLKTRPQQQPKPAVARRLRLARLATDDTDDVDSADEEPLSRRNHLRRASVSVSVSASLAASSLPSSSSSSSSSVFASASTAASESRSASEGNEPPLKRAKKSH